MRSPAYTLIELDEVEKRLDAHIDGMIVSHQIAWRTALAEMKWEDSGEMFALASLALGLKDGKKLKKTFELISNDETAKGLISALGWQSFNDAQGLLDNLVKSDNPTYQFVGLSGYAVHRKAPDRKTLTSLLRSDDERVRARSHRIIGELKLLEAESALEAALVDDSEACQFNAAWSLALFRNSKGIEWLRNHCQTEENIRDGALEMLLRSQPSADSIALIRSLVSDEQNERLAIQAVGILGDPTSVAWLITQMETVELARVAGESLANITGVDIEEAGLAGDVPADYTGGPNDDLDDDNVALDEDDDLPWPEQARVAMWWQQHKSGFTAGQRYFCGLPLSRENCQSILRAGHQRARYSAAIELALLGKSEPFHEVRSRAIWQLTPRDERQGIR